MKDYQVKAPCRSDECPEPVHYIRVVAGSRKAAAWLCFISTLQDRSVAAGVEMLENEDGTFSPVHESDEELFEGETYVVEDREKTIHAERLSVLEDEAFAMMVGVDDLFVSGGQIPMGLATGNRETLEKIAALNRNKSLDEVN